VAFLVAEFILASNGTNSMIITSNEIYKIKADSFFRRRLKAIMMTLSLVGLFFFLLVVPIWGDTIFAIIKITASKKVPIDFIYKVFKLLQYPLTILVLYFNIKLMYITAPDEKIESKETTKGAIFTTVGWILASEIYSFYISTFSNYSLFYGSISNVVILLLWVYILSYIFVLGMIINVGNYQQLDNQKEA
jgi:membrane protein